NRVEEDQGAARAEPVDRNAAERAEERARERPRKGEQRDLRRTGVEAIGRVSPQRNERAPAPDAVDGLADQQQHETTIAQRGHRSNGSSACDPVLAINAAATGARRSERRKLAGVPSAARATKN